MNIFRFIQIITCMILTSTAAAQHYAYQPSTPIIGKIQTIQARSYDTFEQLARTHDIGYDELLHANPDINPYKIPPGTVMILPTHYILPQAPHRGIVVNLPEKRLYVYRSHRVYTFPIGIGRVGWTTPVGQLRIISKQKNPAWYVPKAVRATQAELGNPLPAVVPAGPNNPLGDYALRLSKSNYLIHGTHDPSGVGKRSSAGCLRMYPEDIKRLYHMIPINTPVTIIKQPLKTAQVGSQFWVESHSPLIEMMDDHNRNDGAHLEPTLSLNETLDHLRKDMRQAHITPHSKAYLRMLLNDSSGLPLLAGRTT